MKKILLVLGLITTLPLMGFCAYYSGFGGQQFDEDSGGLVTIDSVHRSIHDGNSYTISVTTLTLANATSCQFVLDLTSNTITKEVHLEGVVTVTGASKIDFYEDSVFITTGTNKTALNRNRDSANTYQAGIKLSTNPTGLTSLGTLLQTTYTGAASAGPFGLGGSARGENEWVLKPGKLYNLNVLNSSGGNIVVNVVLDFYEAD